LPLRERFGAAHVGFVVTEARGLRGVAQHAGVGQGVEPVHARSVVAPRAAPLVA
jgi:hypothetical protein